MSRDWLEYLDNPEAVLSLFKEVPLLDQPEIIGVELSRDGPQCSIALSLSAYPTVPPARWIRQKANAIALTIELTGVVEISILGWSTVNCVAVSFSRNGDQKLLVQAMGPTTRIEILCGWARVAKLNPYLRALSS